MRFLMLLSTLVISTLYNVFFKTETTTLVANETRQPKEIISVEASATTAEKAPGSVRDLLTQGSWKIVSIVSDVPCDTDGDGVKTTDIYDETPQCAKDDVMHIKSNNTVVFDRYTHCDLTEKDHETYQWKMGKNGSFTIFNSSISAKMTVKSVSNSQLVMDVPMEVMGEMIHYTVTYEQVGRP